MANFEISETRDKWATWWKPFKRPNGKHERETFITVLRKEARMLVYFWSNYCSITCSSGEEDKVAYDRAVLSVKVFLRVWNTLLIQHCNNSYFPQYCLGASPVDPAIQCRSSIPKPERVGYLSQARHMRGEFRIDLNEICKGGCADLLFHSMKLRRPHNYRKKKLPIAFTESPLHIAAVCGHKMVTEVLLAYGVPVDQHDVQGRTALDQAVHWGHIDVVRTLLANKASVRGGGTGSHGYWILHRARECSPALVKLLVDAGADPNVTTNRGQTALHVACSCWGSEEAVKILLAAGAHVNVKDVNQETPLHCASEFSRLPGMVDQLIKAGADVNAVRDNKETPLHLACGDDASLEKVTLLLDGGALVSAKDEKDRFPIHIASFYGHSSVIKKLLGAKSPVNTGGISPLHMAARWGHNEAVAALIEAGARVNCLDGDQCSPLVLACRFGHSKVATMLLKAGADTEIPARSIHKEIDESGYFW